MLHSCQELQAAQPPATRILKSNSHTLIFGTWASSVREKIDLLCGFTSHCGQAGNPAQALHCLPAVSQTSFLDPVFAGDPPDIHDGIAGAGAKDLQARAGECAGDDGALLDWAHSAGHPRRSRDLRIEVEKWKMVVRSQKSCKESASGNELARNMNHLVN